MIFRRLWPYLLGVAALAVMYLDRPVGLRATGSHGSWKVEGWAMGSPLPMTLAILMLSVAVLTILVHVTNRRRKAIRP
jgi:hypothetical protein